MSFVPLLLYCPFAFSKEESLAIAAGSGSHFSESAASFRSGMADAILKPCLIRGTVEPRSNEGPGGLAKCVHYKELSLYRGSFPYILL